MLSERATTTAKRPPVKPDNGLLAVELELLGKLAVCRTATTIGELFDRFNPTWAVDAAHRLTAKGEVTRDKDGRYAVTAAGRKRLEQGK